MTPEALAERTVESIELKLRGMVLTREQAERVSLAASICAVGQEPRR